MKMYIAYGTREFLASHKQEGCLLLDGATGSALICETDGPNPFEEKHVYEIINKRGELKGGGFVVMNHIPVSEEGRPLFEERFQNRAGLVEKEPGFMAIRILRPLSQDPFIVMTIWEKQSDFLNWQQSNAYEQAHKDRGTTNALPQTLFTGPSFVKEFTVI